MLRGFVFPPRKNESALATLKRDNRASAGESSSVGFYEPVNLGLKIPMIHIHTRIRYEPSLMRQWTEKVEPEGLYDKLLTCQRFVAASSRLDRLRRGCNEPER